jgi:GT2 family glycosyltransferase
MTELSETPQISIVISTYNRCDQLRHALNAVLDQRTHDLSCEVIVVDNNSTDATRPVIESLIRSGATNLRYVFEPRQGSSYGRNAGIEHAAAPLIAFTDDDIRPAPDWVNQLKQGFDEHPEVDFIGGKVLPLWRTDPPAWLTPDHWSPLALVDYGDKTITVDAERPLCLVGANLAFRREVFRRVGMFSPKHQLCGRDDRNGIGSTEDYDMELRIWNNGGKGLYAPDAVVISDVDPDRLTKAYHRRWYAGHARFSSRMRLKEIFSADGRLVPQRTQASRLFGVPSFVYLELFWSLARWTQAAFRRDESGTFFHENRVRHCVYYIRQLYLQHAAERNHSPVVEVAQFIRTVLRKKLKTHAVKSQPAA